MDQLAVPWLFLGPSGSGKLSLARSMIETAYNTKLTLPMEIRHFNIGDGYEAKVLASPFHFEIDIPNLSMQDKQIIGELLTTFFSSGDVFNSLRTQTRKLVILRRAHSLSLPAAIRVRAILQQYVLPPDSAGMVWITAREITGPLAILEDAFVKHSVPRMTFSKWSSLPLPPPLLTNEAWSACEGRKERADEILKYFPDGNIPTWPRRIQDYYDEMVRILIQIAADPTPPKLDIVVWIRGRIYQALSYCQTGPEIIDSCAAALQRNIHLITPLQFMKVMHALTLVEPHTSYRTPLSLEAGVLTLFETLRTSQPSVPKIPRPSDPIKINKSSPMNNETEQARLAQSASRSITRSDEPAAIIGEIPAAVFAATAVATPTKRRGGPRKKTSGAK
jgi:hypothetical protein